MGKVLSKLSECQLDESLYSTRMIIEDCENIHLHYRDLRLEFSPQEFEEFAKIVSRAKDTPRPKPTEYRVLAKGTIAQTADYFQGRLVVELVPGGAHIHYNNFRLELSLKTFQKICAAFMPTTIIAWVPLESIDAYEYGHPKELLRENFPTETSFKQHTERIAEIREALKAGKRIRPIAVNLLSNGRFKRIDGYCRYMAHRLSGIETIECIIGTSLEPACQKGLPSVIENVY